MDQLNHNIKQNKNKHLDFKERLFIQIKLGDGYSGYRIAQELERPRTTIYNEIKSGLPLKLKMVKKLSFTLLKLGKLYIKKIVPIHRSPLKFLNVRSSLTMLSTNLKIAHGLLMPVLVMLCLVVSLKDQKQYAQRLCITI